MRELFYAVIFCSFLFTGIYFIIFHNYEHTSVVSMKSYEEPQLMLNRYKSGDLVLTPEEFQSLSASYPSETYVSNPRYYFMIDGFEVSVTYSKYNAYTEGDTIVYYKGLVNDRINLD